MPYPNEHSARLRAAGDFAASPKWSDGHKGKFRRSEDSKLYGRIKLPKTISVMWGKLKGSAALDDSPIAAGLRFAVSAWTPATAKAWLAKNKVKYIAFSPAKPAAAKAAADLRTAPRQIDLQADLQWIEAAGDSDPDAPNKLPRFVMTVYTGGVLRLRDWAWPIVMDLAGLKVPAGSIPILKNHDPDQIVGHSDKVDKSESLLTLEGVVSGTGEAATEVRETAQNDFPWRASLGAIIDDVVFVAEGTSAKANGREFEGPVYLALKATLGEVSFVPFGADGKSEARVAARGALENKNMPKTQTENEIRTAERERIQQIETVCSQFPQFQTDELQASAIAETITFEALQAGLLAQVRSHRPAGLAASGGLVDPLGSLGMDTRGGEIPGLKIIEAAACITTIGDGKNVTEMYDEQTLDAADNLRGMGIQEMIECAANLSGVDLPRFRNQPQAWLRAAFSTMSVPVILSNVANKVLVASFSSVENTWRAIAKISALKDFKQSPRYRLTGDLKYELVSPDGELKHASLGEEGYNLKADTRGKMLTITRQDIINDDLNALAEIPSMLGRGAGLSLCEIFWTIFLDNADFFKTANKNYATGAGTALDIDSLTQAEQIFLDQVDKNGHPIGIPPKTLLVPSDLAAISSQLCKSLEIRNPGASKQVAIINPHAGKFSAVASTYLKNSNFPGFSVKAWYLTADANVLPVIEVGFLNGRQTPIIETADADFNTLGISMRGYHDFAVSLADHRGGVKMLGEA